MADHTAHAGILQRRTGAVTREHVVSTTLVSRLAVSHAATQRQLVHHLSRLDPALVDEHTRHVRLNRRHRTTVLNRSIRLGVKAFLMSHPARQENENHRLRRTFLALVLLDVRLSRLQLKVLSQTETNTATKSDVQKASARLTRNHPSLSRNENTSRLTTRRAQYA